MESDAPELPGIVIVKSGTTRAMQPEAAQAHYRNADVTLAYEQCCVPNGYLQSLVWDVNGFS